MKINSERWEQLDTRFFDIIGNADLDRWLSPINRQEEYDKIIAAHKAGKEYNPQFLYEETPDLNVPQLKAYMDDIDRTDPVQDLFYRRALIRLNEIDMAMTHDAALVGARSLINYGRPTEQLIKQAHHNLLTITPEKEDKTVRILNAEESAEICRKALLNYGFTSWVVNVVKEFGAKAAVDNLTKEFIIRADVTFAETTMKMIIVHEIGTHILRAENGYLQPLRIFGTGLPNYMLTEEGLAEYTEVQNDCFDPETHRRISARVIAADMGLKGSFWDIFLYMLPYFQPPMAFDIAQRVKLGIADTSKPGAYTKDFYYLEGLALLTNFFATRSLEDKKLLYTGKISIEHLPLVKELIYAGYLKEPKYIPDFVK